MRYNSLLVSSSNMDASFLMHLWEGIIAKLPPIYRDFAMALIHKRENISLLQLAN
jgi:hypothetical protein